ncbi:uncharacterized protein LOC122851076 [Aphidius gifuensis]|uniref:uncharacterized protein LOC122851076 n=1 Tax=Aphidius gifuensis TaxID=684658 RepID=UPI001CDB9F55|nr:uncharacterized protein LOC122851076 [Aphidius gifuensis]
MVYIGLYLWTFSFRYTCLVIPSNSDSNIINNNNFNNGINKGIVTFPTSNNQPTKTSNNIYHVDGQYRVNTLHKNTDLNDGYLTIEIPSSSIKQQSPYYFTPNDNNAFKNHPTINPYYQLPIVQQNDDVPVVNYQQHYELITPEYYQQNNQLPQYDNQQHNLQQQEKHPHHHHHEQVDINNDKPTEMLYVSSHRETSLTKTRKFPYKYYQPNDDTGIHFIEEGHAFVPRDRQISPWQKLIHLAWAVLPLGLLFAALKSPSRIDRNTTQPNIMLSKWRDGEDLPVEHKKKIDEICDDVKLCETIVHGSDKNSEIVYNILWNFATKSTNEEARKNGLEEIFQAVKKKNCKIITC